MTLIESDTGKLFFYYGGWLLSYSDSGWQSLTAASPFAAGPLGLRYRVLNQVGYIQIGATGTWSATATITTVPAAAVPSKAWWCTADLYGNGASPATVNTDGTVTVGSAGSSSGLLLCTSYPLG
jgi:hypothetical protein